MPYKDPEKAKKSAKERGKKWRQRNLETQRAREKEVKRKDRLSNPTKGRDTARQIRAKNPEKVRKIWRQWKYGLSPEHYDALILIQDGACAICKINKKLVVDHCHTTGKVRGLLCDPCNRALGVVKENKTTLENAIIYLNKNEESAPQP